MDKPRFPYATALPVAQDIVEVLRPFCTRIQIAGSLRRHTPSVGDIEILFIPRIDTAPSGDLFNPTTTFNAAEAQISQLLITRYFAKRLNSEGRETFGDKNKLLVHLDSGIPVDLFTATPENWVNYLVCRTGPAKLNALISTRARERGWMWHPYGSGFSTIRGNPAHFHVTEEEDVFRLVGLPYLPPEKRSNAVH